MFIQFLLLVSMIKTSILYALQDNIMIREWNMRYLTLWIPLICGIKVVITYRYYCFFKVNQQLAELYYSPNQMFKDLFIFSFV